MMLSDAAGRILGMWGGYSPKRFDGDWLKDHKKWFEDTFDSKDRVVADNHFSFGRDHIKVPTFYVNYKSNQKRSGGQADDELPKKRVKYNDAVAHVKARVEESFSSFKRWKLLGQPFQEDKDEHEHLVFSLQEFTTNHFDEVQRERKM